MAGLLAERLRADADRSRRWERELDAVRTGPGDPGRLRLVLLHPDLRAERAERDGRPRLQFGFALDVGVGVGDPAAGALHLAARLAGGDRQQMAEVQGWSRHHAEDHA
ncbi:hypothetical protein ACFV30_01420 [Streptomyces sp. NPDC059752]|uniref:hypothetical protein n=1 Tax=unclassified Streptomyces TaxID=2593676 RepID=UPI003646B797